MDENWRRVVELMHKWMGVRAILRGFMEAFGEEGMRQLWGCLRVTLRGEEDQELNGFC